MDNYFTPAENYIEIINRFCFKCERTVSSLSSASQKDISDILSVLFKRWFFSSIMDNTIISPANLLSLETEDICSGSSFADCDLSITKKKGTEKYKVTYHIVSENNHPFIKDLLTLVDFCTPAAEFDGNGHLSPAKKENLRSKLSITDKYYIDYLSAMGMKLGLFEKIPSLFTTMYRPSAYCSEFFSGDTIGILRKITYAAFRLCANTISSALFLPDNSFTADSFRKYFENTVTINEIIRDIYKSLDINIEEVIEKFDADNVNREDKELLSSVNYVGYLLARWFVIPLSSYLRLIRPLYPVNDDITDQINFISSIITINGFVEAEVFTPPNLYTLTPLGKLLSPTKEVRFNQEIPKSISSASIYDSLSKAFTTEKFNYDIEDFMTTSKNIYTLKVQDKKERAKWVNFEFDGDTVLSSLCLEILDVFALGEGYNYSFIKPSDTNVEVRFTYDRIKGHFNDPENISIATVLKEEGDKLILEVYDISASFSITLVKIENGKTGIVYPRPVKQSKDMANFRDKL